MTINDQIYMNMKMSGRFNRILSPHKFEITDSVYGENDIQKIWYDPGYDTDKWPDPTKAPKSIMTTTDPVEGFYRPLFERMRQKYWDYAHTNHDYKTYDQLRNLPCCNISKLCEDTHVLQDTVFHMEKNDRQIAEQYGSDIFLPCLPEYCIKLQKNNTIYIKLLEHTDGICRAQFANYLMARREAICLYRYTVQYQYDADTKSMNWIVENCINYENFLTEFVPKMGWSEPEKRFWYDIFGVAPLDSATLVRFPVVIDNNGALSTEDASLLTGVQQIVVYDKADVEWLVQQFKKTARYEPDMCVKIMDSGESVLLQRNQAYLDNNYHKYITAIALVNLQFIKNNITVISADQINKNIEIGSMTVKTKTPLRTLFSIRGV